MKVLRSHPIEEVLSQCQGAFLAIVVFSLVVNLLMLAAPLYALQIFDRVLSSRSQETLLYLTLIVAATFVALGILEAVRGLALVRISGWIDNRLSGITMRSSIDSALVGDKEASVQGLRDLTACTSFLSGPGLLPILDAPWSLIFLTVIFLFHTLLGVLALSGVVVLFVLIAVNEVVTRRLLNRSSSESIRLLEWAQSAVSNAEVLKAMGMTENLLRQWSGAHGDVVMLRDSAGGRAASIKALTRSLRMFLQIAMLGMGAWLVLDRQVTPGAMIAGSILFSRAMSPLDQIIGTWRSAIGAREAYCRLREQLKTSSFAGDFFTLPRPAGHLRVEGVVFGYPGSRDPCLKVVEFELRAGRSLGIVGPTAAGKTTLARLMVGNIAPRAGKITLDGADVATWDSADLGQYVGYLPQDVELFSGSVRNNIGRMGDVDDSSVFEAARLAEAHQVILDLKDGYETEVGRQGGNLSGGQRQRIALARALFGDPRFVVLDEPNANLDQEGEQALGRTLLRLNHCKITTVVITHRIWILRHVDNILLLRNGRVEMFGARDEILAKIARPVPAQAGGGIVGSVNG